MAEIEIVVIASMFHSVLINIEAGNKFSCIVQFSLLQLFAMVWAHSEL